MTTGFVFGVVETVDGKPPILMIGVPKAAWDHMADGKCQTLDLTKAGYPIRIMLYGGADQDACRKIVEDACRQLGVAINDQRLRDFSIEPKP